MQEKRPERNLKKTRNMEDLGDILFWVLAAAVGIIGALVNKKKKKMQTMMPQSGMPDEEEQTIYQDTGARRTSAQQEMFDEDILQKTDSAYEGAMMGSSEEQAFKMGAEYEGEYSEPMADDFAMEGTSATDLGIQDTELGTGSGVTPQEKNSRARRLIEDFDLPKAIVYSEILNRKDFV